MFFETVTFTPSRESERGGGRCYKFISGFLSDLSPARGTSMKQWRIHNRKCVRKTEKTNKRTQLDRLLLTVCVCEWSAGCPCFTVTLVHLFLGTWACLFAMNPVHNALATTGEESHNEVSCSTDCPMSTLLNTKKTKNKKGKTQKKRRKKKSWMIRWFQV